MKCAAEGRVPFLWVQETELLIANEHCVEHQTRAVQKLDVSRFPNLTKESRAVQRAQRFRKVSVPIAVFIADATILQQALKPAHSNIRFRLIHLRPPLTMRQMIRITSDLSFKVCS